MSESATKLRHWLPGLVVVVAWVCNITLALALMERGRRVETLERRLVVANAERSFALCQRLYAILTINAAADVIMGRASNAEFVERFKGAIADRDKRCPDERRP